MTSGETSSKIDRFRCMASWTMLSANRTLPTGEAGGTETKAQPGQAGSLWLVSYSPSSLATIASPSTRARTTESRDGILAIRKAASAIAPSATWSLGRGFNPRFVRLSNAADEGTRAASVRRAGQPCSGMPGSRHGSPDGKESSSVGAESVNKGVALASLDCRNGMKRAF
jgi:hypothetical protein